MSTWHGGSNATRKVNAQMNHKETEKKRVFIQKKKKSPLALKTLQGIQDHQTCMNVQSLTDMIIQQFQRSH